MTARVVTVRVAGADPELDFGEEVLIVLFICKVS